MAGSNSARTIAWIITQAQDPGKHSNPGKRPHSSEQENWRDPQYPGNPYTPGHLQYSSEMQDSTRLSTALNPAMKPDRDQVQSPSSEKTVTPSAPPTHQAPPIHPEAYSGGRRPDAFHQQLPTSRGGSGYPHWDLPNPFGAGWGYSAEGSSRRDLEG